MTKIDIFANHPKGSPGARAIDLAKTIPSLWRSRGSEPKLGPESIKEMHQLILITYKRTTDAKELKSERDRLKRMKVGPYSKTSESWDGIFWQGMCAFQIALTLRNAINGDEQKAWCAIADASWIAGFGNQYLKTDRRIIDAMPPPVENKRRKVTIERHESTPQRKARDEIESLWLFWQVLDKKDLEAPKLFKNKTAFAHLVLINFPALKGSKSLNPEVILRWIRGWEKKYAGQLNLEAPTLIVK